MIKSSLRRILRYGFTVLAVWQLTSCYYGDPGYVNPSYPGGGYVGGGGHNDRRAYKQGASYGVQDARRGLTMQPSRYWNNISVQDRVPFSQGYNDAYTQNQNQGGGHGHDRNDYNQGANYGVQDARRGLTMQPSRYWHLISAQSRVPFSQGYNDAYQRTR